MSGWRCDRCLGTVDRCYCQRIQFGLQRDQAAMNVQAQANNEAAGQRLRQQQDLEASDFAAFQSDNEKWAARVAAQMVRTAETLAPTVELDAAKKRIAELEAEVLANRQLRSDAIGEMYIARDRSSDLGDKAGALRTERDDPLRENAVLRRKLEAAERKKAKR